MTQTPMPQTSTHPARRVIDMRCRPALLHDFFGATPGSPEHTSARWLNRRVGTRGSDAHFEQSLTQAGFLDAVHSAGLSQAVVVGRHTPSQHVPIAALDAIVRGHDVLRAVVGVDPVLQGQQVALQHIEHAITALGFVGVNIEPGFGQPARHPDDAVYWPIYELARDLQVPVFVMSGPTTPDPVFNDPAGLAKVAQAFPDLPLVVYHGYWPHVQQAIGLAFRYENGYLVPDMYAFLPGKEALVQAANQFLANQLLFGSSYPFRPIGQSIEDFTQLGFDEAILDQLLYGNAARLLRLAGAAPAP